MAQPDKRPTNRTVLCWSGMTNIQYNCSYEIRKHTDLHVEQTRDVETEAGSGSI